MTLLDMPPGASVRANRMPCGIAGHSEDFSSLVDGAAQGDQFAHRSHIGLGKLRGPMPSPKSMALAGQLVIRVLLRRTGLQMIRSHARRVVALVSNVLFGRKGTPVGEFPGYARRSLGLSGYGVAKLAVSTAVVGASPGPASGSLGDVTPKTLGHIESLGCAHGFAGNRTETHVIPLRARRPAGERNSALLALDNQRHTGIMP